MFTLLYKGGRWGIASPSKLVYNLKLREHTQLKIESAHAQLKIESAHAQLKIERAHALLKIERASTCTTQN